MSATIYINKNEQVDCSSSGLELVCLLLLQFINKNAFPNDESYNLFLFVAQQKIEFGGSILDFKTLEIDPYKEAANAILKAKEYLETLPIPERNAWFESHGFIGAAYDNESPRCIKKILEQLAEKLVEDPRWDGAKI